MSINDQSTSIKPSVSIPLSPLPMTKPSLKTEELPKIQLQRFEKDTRKRRKPTSKQSLSVSQPPLPILLPPSSPVSLIPSAPLEPIKVLPLTLFDFNGSSDYYEHMISFVDTNALHLICIHTANFEQATPAVIEDIFKGTFDLSSSSIVRQLFQILQLLCDKATKTRAMMIIPIATCIDLYDKRPKEET
jgi:hypothetical protein